ncbi:MAG: hypothetical protein HY925_15485 [Elusimicrobia bacterium]|nr:hypothetical protein [Elusimicrobiota bacterium]
MKTMKLLARAALVAVAAWSLMPADAHAITAWARKYGVSCNVCHVAGYKLTATGQKFLRGGHRMPGSPAEVDTKSVKLAEYTAITMKLRSSATGSKVVEQDKEDVKKSGTSFQAHALSLYSGGPLDKGFSYFAEYYLSENESVSADPAKLVDEKNSLEGNWARSKLAEAYLQYHKYWGDDVFWTARMGRIMSSLVHLHGGGARLEYSRPLPFNTNAGDNPYKAYNRQYGWATGLNVKDAFFEAGIVNGTGKVENAVELDADHHKDVFVTADYTLDDNGSMLGAYWYKGYYPLHWIGKAQGGDRFYQYGLMGNWQFKGPMPGAFVGSVLLGNDRFTPTGKTDEMNHQTLGYYVEAQAHFKDGDIAPYARWEYFNKDKANQGEKFGPALGINWKPMDHGRFVLEYSRYLTRGGGTPGSATKKKDTISHDATLELQFMF